MSDQLHLSSQQTQSTPPKSDQTLSTEPQQSDMAEQAAGFGAAGRAAYASCRRGADAQKELDARRQQSGQ